MLPTLYTMLSFAWRSTDAVVSLCDQIDIDLGIGNERARVLGIDLTHEYVAINADYRS